MRAEGSTLGQGIPVFSVSVANLNFRMPLVHSTSLKTEADRDNDNAIMFE